MSKVLRIKKRSMGGRVKIIEGTLESLIEDFRYDLHAGNSHCSRVIVEPKSLKSLVSNLNKACMAMGVYAIYEIV